MVHMLMALSIFKRYSVGAKLCLCLRSKSWVWALHLPDHHETARDLADGRGSEEVQDRVGGADACKLTLDVGAYHLGKKKKA